MTLERPRAATSLSSSRLSSFWRLILCAGGSSTLAEGSSSLYSGSGSGPLQAGMKAGIYSPKARLQIPDDMQQRHSGSAGLLAWGLSSTIWYRRLHWTSKEALEAETPAGRRLAAADRAQHVAARQHLHGPAKDQLHYNRNS